MKRLIKATLAPIIALSFATIVFAAEPATKAKLININTATEAELKAVPGVGAEYATKIMAGRPYTKKAELKTKNIIPADSYEKIKKLIDAVC